MLIAFHGLNEFQYSFLVNFLAGIILGIGNDFFNGNFGCLCCLYRHHVLLLVVAMENSAIRKNYNTICKKLNFHWRAFNLLMIAMMTKEKLRVLQ
jgi:hypothetical protein